MDPTTLTRDNIKQQTDETVCIKWNFEKNRSIKILVIEEVTTSYMLRVSNCEYCKSKRPYDLGKYARHEKDITKDEIDRATRTWITDIRNEKFSSKKEQLANPSNDKNLPLVRQLRLLIYTEDGI
ncbi:Hypothetical predicted protein [Mytilus galloprovincialis]|uniref:Uncharacterized protein n=1 Tax=Mytilus galloprovincialis TaxID=29158 RepID=A0A8B6FVM4_MYTGA|nr:Hypothetical predicted protein [Mytilus galloprovincialis]